MKSNDLTAYVDRLYRAALCKTGDAYAAEELAQETFLAALSALSKRKEPGRRRAGRRAARPLRPVGGNARLARASPDRGLRASVGLSSRKGQQKFADRWEKGQLYLRTM